MTQIKRITELLTAAIGVGLLFGWLHVPVAWLLGPMVAGIGFAVLRGSSQPFPPVLGIVGQVILGVATASHFPLQTLGQATTHFVPLLMCIVVTGSMSVLNGYLLWRWADIDRSTGFLGCLPGASYSIVAMSNEMGADGIAVAVLQYLRLLLVVFLVPSIVGWFSSPESLTPATQTLVGDNAVSAPLLYNLFVLAACGYLGIWGGRLLRIPSPTFLGPFLVGLVAFWVFPHQFYVPQWLFISGLLLVGLPIGLQFDWQAVRKLSKAVLIETGLVIVLIVVCLGVGYEFHQLTGVDMMTAVLGSTPGGMSVMIASTVELGGDSGLVLTMQMTRLLTLLLIGPWLAASLIGKTKRTKHSSTY